MSENGDVRVHGWLIDLLNGSTRSWRLDVLDTLRQCSNGSSPEWVGKLLDNVRYPVVITRLEAVPGKLESEYGTGRNLQSPPAPHDLALLFRSLHSP